MEESRGSLTEQTKTTVYLWWDVGSFRYPTRLNIEFGVKVISVKVVTSKKVLSQRSRRKRSNVGWIFDVVKRGLGQNLSPSPRRERRFLGGVLFVVKSWNARWVGWLK